MVGFLVAAKALAFVQGVNQLPQDHRTRRLVVEAVLGGFRQGIEAHHVSLDGELWILLLGDQEDRSAELEVALRLLDGLVEQATCRSGWGTHTRIYRVSPPSALVYIGRTFDPRIVRRDPTSGTVDARW